MAREFLTDEQVEIEITKLCVSPMVQLARKEVRLRYKRRMYLYQLRNLEKRGTALYEQGITMDNIETQMFPDAECYEMQEVI